MHRSIRPASAAITAVTLIALAGQAHAHRPPTPIIPPRQTAQPPAQNPAPLPTAIPIVTTNPQDAAKVKVYQDRLRQIINASGGNTGASSVPRFDGSMGKSNLIDYNVTTKSGTAGIVTLPTDVKVGVWISGVRTSSVQDASGGAGVSAAAGQPTLTPVPFSQAAINDARAKYPKSEGWSEIKLQGGGTAFAKADACETHSLRSALGEADGFKKTDPDYSLSKKQLGTVTDFGHPLQGIDAVYNRDRGPVVCAAPVTGGVPSAPAAPPASSPAAGDVSSPKYSIAADTLSAQTADLRNALGAISDDGRLGRALALTQMAQPTTWGDGVGRLADAYLANPTLVTSKFDEDFADLDEAALRKMLVRAVAEANKQPDAKRWTAVAAIMAAQDRPDRAAEMLTRARKLAADDTTLDGLEGLSKSLGKLKRAAANP